MSPLARGGVSARRRAAPRRLVNLDKGPKRDMCPGLQTRLMRINPAKGGAPGRQSIIMRNTRVDRRGWRGSAPYMGKEKAVEPLFFVLPPFIAGVAGIIVGVVFLKSETRLSGGGMFVLMALTMFVAVLVMKVLEELFTAAALAGVDPLLLLGLVVPVYGLLSFGYSLIIGNLAGRRALTIGCERKAGVIILIPLIGLLWLTFARSEPEERPRRVRPS